MFHEGPIYQGLKCYFKFSLTLRTENAHYFCFIIIIWNQGGARGSPTDQDYYVNLQL